MKDFYMWWINFMKNAETGSLEELWIIMVLIFWMFGIFIFMGIYLSEVRKLKGKIATLWLIGIGLTLLYPFWHIVALIGFFCGLVEFINKLKKEWGFK